MSSALFVDWQDIQNGGWPNLLLGNGFSIGIDDRFNYKSLFRRAVKADKISAANQALFDHDTPDFERVLRRTATATEVVRTLLPQSSVVGRLTSVHENIRTALFDAVAAVHPDREEVSDRLLAIGSVLREYVTVFTTNYDLIPYWAVNTVLDIVETPKESKEFVDGFQTSNDPMEFSEEIADQVLDDRYPDATRLIFVHGGLHLVTRPDGTAAKLRGRQNLAGIRIDVAAGTPLFVSEGTSLAKRRAIDRADYLRWSRHRMEQAEGNVVVFGHSLNPRADAHIAAAFARRAHATSRRVAVSVKDPGGKSKSDLDLLRANAKKAFRAAEVLLFDAASHPLAKLPSARFRRVVTSPGGRRELVQRLRTESVTNGDETWLRCGAEPKPVKHPNLWIRSVKLRDGESSQREIRLAGQWVKAK